MFLHFRLGFGTLVLRQTQGLAFNFCSVYKVRLQAFHIEAERLPTAQSTRILTGLGFVLEWGAAVAAKILVKGKKV